MENNPKFNFFISSTDQPVKRNDQRWYSEFPQNRKYYSYHKNNIQYGDFFSLIEIFFKEVKYNNIIDAVFKSSKINIKEKNIEILDIFLEKHGEFYHPVRIIVSACGKSYLFVLNIALSNNGKLCMESEVDALKKLKLNFSFNYIPAIYYYKKNVFMNKNMKASMFLGEWFQGYHEFHISYDFKKQKKIIVWDPKEHYYLTKKETKDLYRQAAKIMTYYYDIHTFRQIFPWHNAAGDFILKRDHKNIDLKLITVRQYHTLVEISEEEIDNAVILEGVLIFFINLSLRMRIDRIDGVKEITWSEDVSVQGIVEGFLDGLSLKEFFDENGKQIKEIFIKYINNMNIKDFITYFVDVINSYHPDSPDLTVIIENLENHIQKIYRIILNY